MSENLKNREKFLKEYRHYKEIQSEELKKWVLITTNKISSLHLTHEKNIEKFSKKIEKNKKLASEDIGFFIKLLDAMQEKIEKSPENQINKIDELLLREIGNKSILSRIKDEISIDVSISNHDLRYVQFCLQELERQKIFESGIVPDGWLQSDISLELNDLQKQIGKSKKYIKWGVAGVAHDWMNNEKIDL